MNRIPKTLICALLCLHSQAHGGWCDGTRFGLLAMSLSERIDAAAEQITDEREELRTARNRLRYDHQQTLEELGQSLQRDRAALEARTHQLCLAGQEDTDRAIPYQGIQLKDRGEIRAQIRLNLAEHELHRRALGQVAEQRHGLAQKAERIGRKGRELALLARRLTLAADASLPPSGAEDLLRNACAALSEAHKLRADPETLSEAQLIARAAENSGGTGKLVSPERLDSYLKSCSLQATAAPPPAPSKPWWKVW